MLHINFSNIQKKILQKKIKLNIFLTKKNLGLFPFKSTYAIKQFSL